MTTDPRLLELIDAARVLVTQGGTAINRTRLKVALQAIPSDGSGLILSIAPSPAVTQVLARAIELANASNDLFLRTQHLEFALKENPQ